MRNIIPESINRLHKIFKDNGKELFLVGGSVRDYIMGKKPKDFDLATSATPDEVSEILKDYKIKRQGQAFNVVVVFTEDSPKGMEIATFREDIYGDKLGKTRNPDVVLSTIDKDVYRRDLTYNALFFDLDKNSVVDLVGGGADITNKISRFVGDPKLRITEDPLRILRALRFSSRFGFNVEDKSHIALSENSHMLSIITKDRCWIEIKKAFDECSKVNFHKFFTDFVGHGVAKAYFDGIDLSKAFFCDVVESNYLEIYFANLFKKLSIPDLEKILVDEYKFESTVAHRVAFLCELYKGIDPNQIQFYYKNSKDIQDMVNKWFEINDFNSDIHKAFLEYKPVSIAKKFMEQGYKLEALGVKIKQTEIEHFNNLIKKNK